MKKLTILLTVSLIGCAAQTRMPSSEAHDTHIICYNNTLGDSVDVYITDKALNTTLESGEVSIKLSSAALDVLRSGNWTTLDQKYGTNQGTRRSPSDSKAKFARFNIAFIITGEPLTAPDRLAIKIDEEFLSSCSLAPETESARAK